MAFNLQNWSNLSTGLNKPIVTLSGVTVGINSIFSYQSNADTIATIGGANYFTQVAFDCAIGDLIYANGSDSIELMTVTAINTAVVPATITTSAFSPAGSVGTANLVNNAVTVAKMQQSTAYGFFGNATGSTANVAQNNFDNLSLVYSGTTLGLATNYLQHARVTVSSAQYEALYATPLLAIAAPAAGHQLVVDYALWNYTYGTAAYAAGGNLILQYGNTIHGAGTGAITAFTPTGFSDQTASTAIKTTGIYAVGALNAATGLYLSNASGAFTTGDGTFTVDIWYKTVAVA